MQQHNNFSFHFGLENKQNQLDFIDINLVRKDNLLFIDPRLISLNTDDISKQMDIYLKRYWGKLISDIKNKRNSDAFRLMRGLSEPKETHLGFSEKKNGGNSVGDKIKPKLITELFSLINDKNAHITNIEDMEFFIDNVGEDRISDITTKIIKSVLIDFTIKECKKHKIKETQTFFQKDIWNHKTGEWESKSVELPCYNNKPIILVPKNIVRLKGGSKNIASCFYRFAIRDYVMNNPDLLKEIFPTGKDESHLRKDVKNHFPKSKDVLNDWNNKFPLLMVNFKSNYLKEKIRPLDDDQIEAVIYDPPYKSVG
ncbi:hypothetical protein [Elizabethkingia anophelis]|uniref:hypothetical protein n=1 Tax=Elizabethkingia anophelis TaxID=1117645 RepID=UPI00389290A2|nr:hypothetical protein [Elizabethkingia anophelis]